MAKCEHHDEYINLHKDLKEQLNRVEKNVDEKIKNNYKNVDNVNNKVDKAFDKIEELRKDVDSQSGEHLETKTYVKTLYDKFDMLTDQMKDMTDKLDKYIFTIASVQKDTDDNSKFNKRGKDLVYEIIKYIVIAIISVMLYKNGTA